MTFVVWVAPLVRNGWVEGTVGSKRIGTLTMVIDFLLVVILALFFYYFCVIFNGERALSCGYFTFVFSHLSYVISFFYISSFSIVFCISCLFIVATKSTEILLLFIS